MSDSEQAPHILIVDDEPSILKLLSKITSQCGYRCITASNAAEARECLAARQFDLLLTDIQMPGESGIELMKFVKEAYPDTAVVVISVINDFTKADAVLKIGACGYIVKPFERSQVFITIKNALIRRELEKNAKNREQKLEIAVRHRTRELAETVHDLKEAKSKIAATAKYHKDQLLFLQTLLEAIPNPIFYKDCNGAFLGCNKEFEDYIGLSRDEIIGKNIHDVSPHKSADRHHAEDLDLLAKSGRITYEASIPVADGTIRETLFSKATYKNSSGEIDGLVGVMVDITQRKQRERALRISEEKNRNILENISMGVALISPEMKILEMNNKMQRWFPAANADGSAKCYECFVTPGRKDPCGKCPTKQTLEDGRVHEAIVQNYNETRKRDFKIVSSAIKDKDGRVMAAIELISDITEELAIERELRQSQKMASIGQLAAGVAHEINNPTGFVSSNLRTLKDYQNDLDRLLGQYRTLKHALKNDEDQAAIQEMIKHIEDTEDEVDIGYILQDIGELIAESEEGTERIKKIVEDLKHFAHPGQDKVQDTDINKELESTLNVVNNELKYKAEVVTEFNPLPIIQANPQQLNQVFVNILVNAAQSIENMGEIRIKTRHVDGHVEIGISDTGCGIAKENISKIFEPFFTTKEVGKGTGLGMNIAYNIIKKHHGDIVIDSCVGKGTLFTISLPVEMETRHQLNSAELVDTRERCLG